MVRVGIIGAGFGAKVHLPAFLSLPNVEVVGISDNGSGKARNAIRDRDGVKAFGDWRFLIENKNIDAISIASPPANQSEIVCAALKAGRHVLCEKPFGRSYAESHLMVELATQKSLVNAVDYHFRAEPGIAELKRQLVAGIIGRILRVDVTWLTGGRANPELPWGWQHDATSGGGVLEGFGSHVIDYVQWLCCSHITHLSACTQIMVGERLGIDGSKHRVTSDDSCDLVCNLACGVIANLRVSNCYPFGAGHRIEVFGSLGRLVFSHHFPFSPDQASLHLETGSRSVHAIPFASPPYTPGVDTRISGFRELAAGFVDAVLGNKDLQFPDFVSALTVRRVIDVAHLAAEKQRSMAI